jgi:MFS transporter, FHS family, L-fucose permease
MTQNEMQKPNYTVPLIIMASLFFLFGFITTMSNSLIEFLQGAFNLNVAQASLINVSIYGAYILSIPVGWMIKKIGYKSGVLLGLLIVALGYFLFYPVVGSQSFILFLLAMLIVAIGVVLIQVAANPFVMALGSPETSSSRLVLTQSLNSLGTVIAPMFVSIIVLTEANKANGPAGVQLPFLFIAVITVVLTAVLFFIKLPVINEEESTDASAVPAKASVWSYKNMIFGTLGIFVYMGVEVGVPSYFPKFAKEYLPNISSADVTMMLLYYWLGMLVGRFAGIFVLKKFKTASVIALYSVAAAILLAGALLTTGTISMVLLLMTGLFHSIMWPSIFNLGVTGLGPHTKQASGIICTAVIGGAILPYIQGQLAIATSVKVSLILLFLYYAYILFFALKGSKMR